MPVLSGTAIRATLVVAILSLAGCGDRGSPEYQHIKELPYSEWESYAQALPLEERLDLHGEILERSGHNPLMTISGAFDDEPQETYDAIVRRIGAGDISRSYVRILYEINRQDDFAICDQPNRKVVQDYLWNMATDAVQPKDRADFYTC